MRRVRRQKLPASAADYLQQKQMAADAKERQGNLDVGDAWKAARRNAKMEPVLATLRAMAGGRQRCMYCLDSHGTDIEHFWPKKPYPSRMFLWLNLLLCCTECGRFKGDQFPLDNYGQPVLVDPTIDPWACLDFEPATGLITARFDLTTNSYSPRGSGTVQLLRLDQREALNAGYRRSFERLCSALRTALARDMIDATQLFASLHEQDDHGLLGWCFSARGARVPPFSDLRERHEQVWSQCAERAAVGG